MIYSFEYTHLFVSYPTTEMVTQ